MMADERAIPVTPIQVGEVVKSTTPGAGHVIGVVLRTGWIPFGPRKKLAAVLIRLATGKQEILLEEDAVVLGYADWVTREICLGNPLMQTERSELPITED